MSCADGCSAPNDQWKSDLSKQLGGLWFSTTEQGDCSNPQRERCAWSVKQVVKTVNASCVNDNFLKFLAKKAGSCLANCSSADRADTTSSCFVTCVFKRMLGRSISFPNVSHTGMSSAELVAPWLAGFDSEDPAKGGCPALKTDYDAASALPVDVPEPAGLVNVTVYRVSPLTYPGLHNMDTGDPAGDIGFGSECGSRPRKTE